MDNFEKDLKESLDKITLLQQEIKDLAFNYQIKKEAKKLAFESLKNNVLNDVSIESYTDQGGLSKIHMIRFRLNKENMEIRLVTSLNDEITNNIGRKISEAVSDCFLKLLANKR